MWKKLRLKKKTEPFLMGKIKDFKINVKVEYKYML